MHDPYTVLWSSPNGKWTILQHDDPRYIVLRHHKTRDRSENIDPIATNKHVPRYVQQRYFRYLSTIHIGQEQSA
jgi:hypothetical protein